MTTIDFQSNSYSPEHHSDYFIEMMISGAYFAYAIKNSEGALVVFRAYPNEKKLSSLKLWEQVIEQDKLFKSYDFKKTKLIIHTPHWTLVPQKLYEESQEADYLKAVHDINTANYLIYKDTVVTQELWVIYALELKMVQNMSEVLGDINFEHLVTVFLHNNFIIHSSIEKDYSAALDFVNDKFYYTIFGDKKLRFCNQYACNAPEDVVYYLFRVNQTLQINPQELILYTSGTSKLKNEIDKLLKTYFVNFRESAGIIPHKIHFAETPLSKEEFTMF